MSGWLSAGNVRERGLADILSGPTMGRHTREIRTAVTLRDGCDPDNDDEACDPSCDPNTECSPGYPLSECPPRN